MPPRSPTDPYERNYRIRFLCLWFRLLSPYRYLYLNRLHGIPSALVCRVRWVRPTPCFCDTGPQYRCPPFLTDGSRGANSPSFIGTIQTLRLPSPFSLPSVSLDVDTAALLPCFFVQGGSKYPATPGLLVTGQSTTGASRGGGRLSQVPMET